MYIRLYDIFIFTILRNALVLARSLDISQVYRTAGKFTRATISSVFRNCPFLRAV